VAYPHFRLSAFVCFLAACLLTECSTNSVPTRTTATVRKYNGTASVGDFLTISIDSAAQTITYKNYSNGDAGTVPYAVNADGTYSIADPAGDLLTAYEVPGYIMVVQTAKSGPDHNTPALLTAVESVPVSIATFAGRTFNYLQFRTSSGGTEVGTVTIDASGNIHHDGYWPFGLLSDPPDPFNGGSFAASSVTEDPSGAFFTLSESNGSDVVFGTQNGFFAVDTQNGAILGLPKASQKTFDSTFAGSYTAIVYEKPDAQAGPNNTESGTPLEGQAQVVITAAGAVTIRNSQSTLAAGALTPVADEAYLYDGTANELSDPCYGLFTFRTATANSQQDVFMSFQNGAVIFSSFETALPLQVGNPYTYFYGVGLK